MPRVTMISGANRGIGLVMARAFAGAGYGLSLGVRDPARVPADLHTVSAGCLVHAYDAADRGAAAAWVEQTVARFGSIDVLVNNAGISRFVGLESGSEDDLDALFDINVKAPFRVIRAALPHLKASGSGRVINVASLSGKRVMGLNAGYQMSKHAVVALTHAVRRLGWEHGIRATALCPGYIATDMTAEVTDVPHEAMTSAEDLASIAVAVAKLPNTASIAELLVNCRYEHTL